MSCKGVGRTRRAGMIEAGEGCGGRVAAAAAGDADAAAAAAAAVDATAAATAKCRFKS